MKQPSGLVLVLSLVFLSAHTVCARPGRLGTDTLFLRLLSLPVHAMSDAEFRYFDERYESDEDDSVCNRVQLKGLMVKGVAQMSPNEYEFFAKTVFECSTVRPCDLIQYTCVKDTPEVRLTGNERVFLDECRGRCLDFNEKHYPTKAQSVRKTIRRTGWILAGFCLLGGGIVLCLIPTGGR